MNSFLSKAFLAIVVAMSFLLGGELASAGNVPKWGGATTTTQPQPIQQPRKPLVSQPEAIPAQTVQPQQPRFRTSPSTTSSPTVSTPVHQRVSQPKLNSGEAETPMSIAQDECVLQYGSTNPAWTQAMMSTGATGPFGGLGGGVLSSLDPATAAAVLDGSLTPYITRDVVLEKGDYQVMYIPEVTIIQNLNKNNSVEFLVRLPGINMVNTVHTDLDDWTKGKKSRITLRPGDSSQFDEGSGTTLIKVRCL